MRARIGMFAAGLIVLVAGARAQTITVDKSIPEYKPVQGVSGTIKSIGSDTMNNVMAHWNEGFSKLYPGVKVEVEGKGSNTAPPALIKGQAQFGPMSREMKSSESDEFEKAFGYKPTGLRTAIDTLAVYVHRDNPISEISFDQLKKLFTDSGAELTWGALGVTDARLKDQRVVLYGRASSSGTYVYFKEHVLGKTDFRASVKEQAGSSAVVQAVGSDKFGIGYSGIGYKTADVKALKVSHGGKAAEPTYDNALTGDYPIARFLYVYVNYDATKGLDPLRAEFIKFMLGRQGQEGVIKDGYFPITGEIAGEELARVGLGGKK